MIDQISDGGEPRVIINREHKFQTLVGFGGAFTDAAGINIASLSEDLQTTLLRYIGDPLIGLPVNIRAPL